eukprot:TRINITY_DN5411_c0_g1_i2.p1 TRINITY_DN5411_c0_g1~~TRINITY_DN5411_c0_g1_i2.p1  ORF type:complete len:235 (-),score=0.39 TRINITY_DN5411_c0_g1_i2:258-962(-)
MARSGYVDFYHSAHEPMRRDNYLRESFAREAWDHPYHALRNRTPGPGLEYPTYKGLIPSSLEASRKPWRTMSLSSLDDRNDVTNDQTRPHRPSGRMHARGQLNGSRPVHDGVNPLDRAANKHVRRIVASSSSGDLPLGHRMAATQGTLRLSDEDAMSCYSVAASSGKGLTAPRIPRRYRHASAPEGHAGWDSMRPAGSRGFDMTTRPPAAPKPDYLGGAATYNRMPSFARIYGT